MALTREIKIKLWAILVLLSVCLECAGIYKMAGSLLGGMSPVKGAVLVIGGLALGAPSAIIWQYLKTKPDTSLDKDKIAVELLAKLSDNDHTGRSRKPQ